MFPVSWLATGTGTGSSYLCILKIYVCLNTGPLRTLGARENETGLTVVTPNDCGTCLGHQLLYECTTIGTGTTVWKGSAFQCSGNGNSVLLSHRSFSSGTMDTCNHGAIVGQSVRVVNNCYISRLNVTIDASMNGQTIKCFYHNGSREIEIGSETITIRTGIVLNTKSKALIDNQKGR